MDIPNEAAGYSGTPLSGYIVALTVLVGWMVSGPSITMGSVALPNSVVVVIREMRKSRLAQRPIGKSDHTQLPAGGHLYCCANSNESRWLHVPYPMMPRTGRTYIAVYADGSIRAYLYYFLFGTAW